MRYAFVTVLLISCAILSSSQEPPPSTSVSDSITLIWAKAAHDFVTLAEAMPVEFQACVPPLGGLLTAMKPGS